MRAAAEAVGHRGTEEVVVPVPDDQADVLPAAVVLDGELRLHRPVVAERGEVLADHVDRADRRRRGGVDLEVVRRQAELAAGQRRRERARGGRAAVARVTDQRGSDLPCRRTRPSGRRPGSWILKVTDLVSSVLAALSVERNSTTCVPLLETVHLVHEGALRSRVGLRGPLAGHAVGGDAVLGLLDARRVGAGVGRREVDLDRAVERVAGDRGRRVERRRRGRGDRLAGRSDPG